MHWLVWYCDMAAAVCVTHWDHRLFPQLGSKWQRYFPRGLILWDLSWTQWFDCYLHSWSKCLSFVKIRDQQDNIFTDGKYGCTLLHTLRRSLECSQFVQKSDMAYNCNGFVPLWTVSRISAPSLSTSVISFLIGSFKEVLISLQLRYFKYSQFIPNFFVPL